METYIFKNNKKKKHILFHFLAFSFFLIVIFLNLTSYWPSNFHWLANLIQMSPLWIIFGYSIGLLFFALINKLKKIAVLNLLSLFIVVFFIMGFKLNFSLENANNSVNKIRVTTFNLGKDIDQNVLRDFVNKYSPDIIAFQEVNPNHQRKIEAVLDSSKWNIAFQGELGVASLFKIKKSDVINRDIIGRSGELGKKYTLATPYGNIKLFNIHLDTSRRGIEAIINQDEAGIAEITRFTEIQKNESSILSKWIQQYSKVLITGDFNYPQTSFIYQKNWSRYQNAFSKKGFGFGYTKFTRWHGVRIDHILSDENWQILDAQVGPDIGSDHKPVIADLKFIGNTLDNKLPDESGEDKKVIVDPKTLVKEDFNTSFGNFKNSSNTSIAIDNIATYNDSNSIKVDALEGNNGANISMKFNSWIIDKYPILKFAYKIQKDLPLEIKVKTLFNDWLTISVVDNKQLIADDMWHEIKLNVNLLVKTILPKITTLTELQFVVNANSKIKGAFWISKFSITNE